MRIAKSVKHIIIQSTFILGLAATIHGFVSIEPTVSELTVMRGGRAAGEFMVANPTDEMITVGIEVSPLEMGRRNEREIPVEQWLTVSESEVFRLNPGESRPIRYRVRMPADYHGELMAMVYFTILSRGDATGPLSMQYRHGVPVYAFAENTQDIKVDLKQIAAFFADQTQSAPVVFSLKLENAGNVHVRPRGYVRIKNSANVIEETPIEWGWPLFADDTHAYMARTAKVDWMPGSYQAEIHIEYGDIHKRNLVIDRMILFMITGDRRIEQLS